MGLHRTAAALLLLAGCYQPPAPVTVALKTRFEPASVAWAEAGGEGRVEGSALLRTQGGEVRTCAALAVSLVPVTVHARERFLALFGNTRGGFNATGYAGSHPQFANDSPAFYDHVRVTKCDAQGRFRFEELADGDYFVTATVTWYAPGAGPQGGDIMQRVSVRDGETVEVLLTL